MGAPYEDEWNQIRQIASQVNTAREEASTLYERHLARQAQGLADRYRRSAKEYQQKADRISSAQGGFQQLSGFRFGADTAAAGSKLAGQRVTHYEDHVSMLNELAAAAELAVEGIDFYNGSGSIADKGIFQRPNNGQSSRSPSTNKTDDGQLDMKDAERNYGYQVKSDINKGIFSALGLRDLDHTDGTPDLSVVSHEIVDIGDTEKSFTASADVALAAKWGMPISDVIQYRNENGLCWSATENDKKACLIPQSINDEYNADPCYKYCPVTNGEWLSERGNSRWIPVSDYVPSKSNPEKKAWGQILEEYGISGIMFNEGCPDFSEISRGTVEIKSFTDERYENFKRANIEMAKLHKCTESEVKRWRQENKYTWHECDDMKTLQKVPSIIHSNIPHSGGIHEVKERSKNERFNI